MKLISSISMEEMRMTRSLTLQVSYRMGMVFIGGASGRARFGEEPPGVGWVESVGLGVVIWLTVVEELLRLGGAARGLRGGRLGDRGG